MGRLFFLSGRCVSSYVGVWRLTLVLSRSAHIQSMRLVSMSALRPWASAMVMIFSLLGHSGPHECLWVRYCASLIRATCSTPSYINRLILREILMSIRVRSNSSLCVHHSDSIRHATCCLDRLVGTAIGPIGLSVRCLGVTRRILSLADIRSHWTTSWLWVFLPCMICCYSRIRREVRVHLCTRMMVSVEGRDVLIGRAHRARMVS